MPQGVEKVLKRLLDNRFYWNVVEGPLYNILIYRTLDRAYENFLNTLVIPRKATVLDVGSGGGQATLRFAVMHPESSIFGIDYAISQVRTARFLQRMRKVHNTVFKVADVVSIPFRDETFDVVVSLASLKHWSSAKQGFGEIYRVLKPQGSAHIIECNRDTSKEEIDEIACRATRFLPLRRIIAWYQQRVVFGQSYSKEEVFSLAKYAGFGDIHIERMVDLPFLRMILRKGNGVNLS